MTRGLFIDKFKSLVDFKLPPAPLALCGFTCLVGLDESSNVRMPPAAA